MVAHINKDACVSCGAYQDVCPENAITIKDVAMINESRCVDCGACVDECPNDAIDLS